MARFPSVKRLNIFCFIPQYLVPLAFLLSVWFMFQYHQSMSFEEDMQDQAVLSSETTGVNTILFTAQDLKNALEKSDGCLAARRKNRVKPRAPRLVLLILGLQNVEMLALQHFFFSLWIISCFVVLWELTDQLCSGGLVIQVVREIQE